MSKKLSVTKMQMCGKTRKDKIRNEHICGLVGPTPICDKIREDRLQWFGHVRRRPIDAVVRESDLLVVEQNAKRRGKP